MKTFDLKKELSWELFCSIKHFPKANRNLTDPYDTVRTVMTIHSSNISTIRTQHLPGLCISCTHELHL